MKFMRPSLFGAAGARRHLAPASGQRIQRDFFVGFSALKLVAVAPAALPISLAGGRLFAHYFARKTQHAIIELTGHPT